MSEHQPRVPQAPRALPTLDELADRVKAFKQQFDATVKHLENDIAVLQGKDPPHPPQQ